MAEPKELPKRIIWAFGAGYFVFYAPYAGTVKIVTTHEHGVLALFPSVVLGTVAGVAVTLLVTGWWRYARLVREPRRLVSGAGAASIWATTTFAYSFSGVSIVLALLLMRAGVLTLAPAVDLAHRRRVRWFAWAALVLGLGAVLYALLHVGDYTLPLAAAINLGFYLSGYAVRLPTMTKQVKIRNRRATEQYFVDEALVGSAVMIALTIFAALLPLGAVSAQLRQGFASFSVAGFAAGLLYAGLHVFGTMIYLDWRENAFCISLNRCTSLLAGLVVSLAATWHWNIAAVPPSQLAAAGMMLTALLLLSPAHHIFDPVVLPVLRAVGIKAEET